MNQSVVLRIPLRCVVVVVSCFNETRHGEHSCPITLVDVLGNRPVYNQEIQWAGKENEMTPSLKIFDASMKP